MGDGEFKSAMTMYSASTIGAVAEREEESEDYWVVQLDFFDGDVDAVDGGMRGKDDVEEDGEKQEEEGISDEESEDESSEAKPIIQFWVDLIPAVSPSKRSA
jgi:hypothetical protein